MNIKRYARTETLERTLSRNEAKVILGLEWRGQKTVTLADLRESLGASESYARCVAQRLVEKGWLERLRPGLCRLVPAARGREGVADTNPLAAGAVLVSPYFFSFGTARTHHGLTVQAFAEVYIACQVRRRRGTTGKLVRPWNVVENVPREVLLPPSEKLRRRVVFAGKRGRR